MPEVRRGARFRSLKAQFSPVKSFSPLGFSPRSPLIKPSVYRIVLVTYCSSMSRGLITFWRITSFQEPSCFLGYKVRGRVCISSGSLRVITELLPFLHNHPMPTCPPSVTLLYSRVLVFLSYHSYSWTLVHSSRSLDQSILSAHISTIRSAKDPCFGRSYSRSIVPFGSVANAPFPLSTWSPLRPSLSPYSIHSRSFPYMRSVQVYSLPSTKSKGSIVISLYLLLLLHNVYSDGY